MLPHDRDKAFVCIHINKAPVHVQSYCAMGLQLLPVLNLINKGSLLPHITIKCPSSVSCNYERRQCEEKTVHNCETSGYSINTAL